MNTLRPRSLWCAGRAKAAVGLLLVLIGCERSPPAPLSQTAAPPWFEDVTDALGLRFTHDAGASGSYFLPQVIGSGAALFDLDQDGRLDIYLLHNGGPASASKNRLFRQKDDGAFEDISAASGLDVAGHGMGAAVGDVNNDGWPDLVLTEFRGVRLFLNGGKRSFTEVTKQAGLDSVHWATAASFFDYDRDGWLDLVVVHYLDYDPAQKCTGNAARQDFCHPNLFAGAVCQLYRNLGPQTDGTVAFRDVTIASGLAQRPGPGLGVLCADLTGDGWPDIFVANDAKPNRLWVNQKDGTFVEEAGPRGCALNAMGHAEGNMGIAHGDLDGDGLADLVVTHLTEEMTTLWKQGPRGLFADATVTSGLASPRWWGTGFGVVFADFNQDGRLDLAVANGRVARRHGAKSKAFTWEDYEERSQIFKGDGVGKLSDISREQPVFCETPRVARALCMGDICNNGRVDLLVTHIGGPVKLYRNVAPAPGHWLTVRAVVPAWKRDAYGAIVTVVAGKQTWTRLVQPSSSYLSSHDPRVHFGLGGAAEVDAIRVVWPDGAAEEFPGGGGDRRLTLRRGEGKALQP